MFTPTIYSQQDPRWAGMILGTSRFTMGGDGCATASAANMVSRFLQRDVTPGELCAYLKKHGGYTKDGLIIWRAINFFTNNKLVYAGNNKFDLDKTKRHYAILKVQLGFRVGTRNEYWAQSHFVRGMGEQVYDPWRGIVTKFPNDYLKPIKGGYNERYFKIV